MPQGGARVQNLGQLCKMLLCCIKIFQMLISLRQNQSSEKEIQYFLEGVTCESVTPQYIQLTTLTFCIYIG